MRRSVGTQRLRALEIVTMCAAAAGLALCSLPVAADESPDLLNEPFYVALGSFILNSDTKVRLDGEGQRGDQVDFEDTFGGGDTSDSASMATGALPTSTRSGPCGSILRARNPGCWTRTSRGETRSSRCTRKPRPKLPSTSMSSRMSTRSCVATTTKSPALPVCTTRNSRRRSRPRHPRPVAPSTMTSVRRGVSERRCQSLACVECGGCRTISGSMRPRRSSRCRSTSIPEISRTIALRLLAAKDLAWTRPRLQPVLRQPRCRQGQVQGVARLDL